MAGGNLSPRQKMVNLMYLVFIAMLALQMSKEVLTSFGHLANKFESVNTSSISSNEQLLMALQAKANDDPTYKESAKSAEEISKISKGFFDFLGTLKEDATKGFERDEKGNLPYESMDKGDNIDELWFKGDKYSSKGEEIVKRFNQYVTEMEFALKLSKNNSINNALVDLKKRFDTKDVTNNEGFKQPFLNYHFQGFPAIASLTKVTSYQNDVKKTEADLYNILLGKAAIEATSMNKYQAILVLDKNAYFSGEKISGKVVLGRYDENTIPTSFSGPGKIENGQAIIGMTAGGVGEQNIGGKFTFKQDNEIIEIPWKGTYVVVPKPNQATISADKMNVVYRGLDNPMSISFAGVADNAVNASAAGLSKTGNGKYMMRPAGSGEVVINVTAKLPDGSTVSDKKAFRIKSPPPPIGHVRGEADVVRGPAQSLAGSSVTAKSLDFDFDATWSVQSFVVKVPGQGSVRVNGSTMNGSAQAAIKKATRGDQVNITEIIATGPGGVKLKASPVVYEVQ